MVDRIIAACDGASKGNPGRAAWAWVIADAEGDPQHWEAGPLGVATNNVAELTALERLLAATDPTVAMDVRMDSQYAMKAVTTWLPGWKRNGWRTAAGKPVANQDLVVRIDELLAHRTVEFVYVAAHRIDGDRLNAFADQAASQAAATQQAAGSSRGSQAPVVRPGAAPTGAGRRQNRRPGPSEQQKSALPKSALPAGCISARFPGRCRCGKPYAAGDPITKNPQGWGHPACRATAAERPERNVR